MQLSLRMKYFFFLSSYSRDHRVKPREFTSVDRIFFRSVSRPITLFWLAYIKVHFSYFSYHSYKTKMSSRTKRLTTRGVQLRTQGPITRKRSLSTSLSNQENKKKFRSVTAKRYKSLLTCTICDGDAHGNEQIIKIIFHYR